MLPIVLILPVLVLASFHNPMATEMLPWVSIIIPLTVFSGNIKIIHTLNYSEEGAVMFGHYAPITGILGMTAATQMYVTEYQLISGIVGFSSALIFSAALWCLYMGESKKVNKLFEDDYYSSEKIQSIGFKPQRSLKEMNETSF